MQKFRLNHMKSFADSKEIDIKPITIFVGKNSCGKSSLLRFPVVLAQTFREEAITPLLFFGNMIDYGNYDDVLYKHEDNCLVFKLSFGRELSRYVRLEAGRWRSTMAQGLRNHFYSYKSSAELQVTIDKPLKKIEVKKAELYLDTLKICDLEREGEKEYIFRFYQFYNGDSWEKWEKEIILPEAQFDKFIPFVGVENLVGQFCLQEGLTSKENDFEQDFGVFFSYDKFLQHVDELKKPELEKVYCMAAFVQAYFRGIKGQLADEAANMVYIGPFRENPKRIYRDSESSYNDVGVNGEYTGMLLRQAAQENTELLGNVSGWFQDAMGYSLDVKEAGNGLFSIMVRGRACADNIMDVGYGISQVLPIVTQLYNANNTKLNGRASLSYQGTTAIFEQPEIHLHPAAQAQLADLFVNCVTDKKNPVNRILIETHSEHLIRKLQVLVADPESGIDSDQVAIYYVDKNEEGNSYIEKMELCENGQFEKAWPSGFFDKSYELTKLLMRAGRKKS